jgi:hypothetical protein
MATSRLLREFELMLHSGVLRLGILMAPIFLAACLSVPKVDYRSVLEPKESEREEHSIGDDGIVSYHLEGSRIDVQYMTEPALNEMFPDDSKGEELSTNPYTYGDWIDPNVGYVRNRFTVFNIAVYNYTYAKMQLDPLKVILLTDRGGYLESYTIAPVAERKSLEGYFRGLRGISGNEHYRFSKRIGIVRGSAYGEDEVIFKGENYSGLVVFDPLHPKVRNVRVILKEFALKFDASGHPIETIDIPFDFNRTVSKEVIADGGEVERGPTETTRVIIRGPRQIRGNQQGDLARNTGAINSIVDHNLTDLRRCFSEAFDQGDAVEGMVEVQFTIRVHGVVEAVSVTESTVMNAPVGDCIVAEIQRWQFQPAGQYAQQAGSSQQSTSQVGEPGSGAESRQDASSRPQRRLPVTDVMVVYPLTFEEIE